MSDEILILRESIEAVDLRRLVSVPFGDLVKFVADVDRQVIAIGGQMHADAEHALLDAGSDQPSLWGGNYFPGRGEEGCIEYTSFINVRPAQGNRGMELVDPGLRSRIRELVHRLIGRGEDLPDVPA